MTAGPTSPETASAATSGGRCRPARTACSSRRSASGGWAREPAEGRWAAGNDYLLNPEFTADRVPVTRPTGWIVTVDDDSASRTPCRTPSPGADGFRIAITLGAASVFSGSLSQAVECRAAHTVPPPRSGPPKASPTPAQGSPLPGGRRLPRHRPETDGRRVAGRRPRRPAPDLGESHRQPRGPQPRQNPGPLRRLTVAGPRAALTETPGSFEPVRSLTALLYASMVGACILSPRTMVSHHMCP
ncbi:hypothetical protein RKD26_006067 [Streptomyces calvus]